MVQSRGRALIFIMATETDITDQAPLAPFIAYLVFFHAAWAGWVYFLFPAMKTLGEATLVYALVNNCVRLLVWVLPVFCYLRYVDGVDPVQYLRLKQNWRRGILVGLGLTAINFLLSLTRFGVPHPSFRVITWNSVLGTSLLIGFVEEIPYRGFIFQKFRERLSFWVANLISSLLFLAIHLPGWISLHLLSLETIVFVFFFGILMVVIFRYSGSLWSTIVSHSLNDFLSAIVFRQ
jgi:membrane protease YdiL (CAAX protease family)